MCGYPRPFCLFFWKLQLNLTRHHGIFLYDDSHVSKQHSRSILSFCVYQSRIRVCREQFFGAGVLNLLQRLLAASSTQDCKIFLHLLCPCYIQESNGQVGKGHQSILSSLKEQHYISLYSLMCYHHLGVLIIVLLGQQ